MPRRRGRPGLVGTMARTAVIAGTATAVSGAVSGKQQQKAAAKQQEAAAPPAAPAAPTDDDKFEKLTKLAELKTAGVLTEEEFAAEKAKILNS